jgi:hypothetical protein
VRRAALVGLVVLCLFAQLSLLPALRPFGVVPNVALVLVALLGLEATASTALVVAVVGGLALDLASGANFGLWTGVLVLAALAGGLAARAGVEVAGGLVAALMVAAGTVVMGVVILAGVAGSVTHWPWAALVVGLALQVVLNLVLTVAGRPVVQRLALVSDSRAP